jgi:hypothetical protein
VDDGVTTSEQELSGDNDELPNGSELLDIIYNKVKSLATAQAGCTYLLRSLLSAFLTTVSAPYFTVIGRWLGLPPNESTGHRRQQTLLYDHNLHTIDPHREFFVQATNHVDPSLFTQNHSAGQLNTSNIAGIFSSNMTIPDADQYWYLSFQVVRIPKYYYLIWECHINNHIIASGFFTTMFHIT